MAQDRNVKRAYDRVAARVSLMDDDELQDLRRDLEENPSPESGDCCDAVEAEIAARWAEAHPDCVVWKTEPCPKLT